MDAYDSPLGLTYRPTYPLVQSMIKQAQQSEMIRLKQAEEARKNALTMANEAVSDFYKFKDDKRPYVSALEPYFQKGMDNLFQLSQQVRRGQADPNDLRMGMAQYQNDVTEATRKDAIVSSARTTWDKSGIRDMSYLDQKYATYAVDLNSTAELGTVTFLDPRSWDANQYVNDANLDLKTYKPTAMAQNFITDLMKSEADATLETDYAGNVINKNLTLKEKYISKTLGASGQQTLEFGKIGDPGPEGDQARGLLNAFRTMGPEYENFLKLRAMQDNPEFAKMQEGSDAWGLQMQQSLYKVMQEVGRVPSKPSATAYRPPSSGGKDTGTTFDASLIGGNKKTHLQYMTEAKEYMRFFDPDPAVREGALDMFYGKGVSEVQYLSNGQAPGMKPSENGYVKIKLDKRAEQYNPLMAFAKNNGGSIDENEGVIYIPLDPSRIKSLSSFANLVRPQDLNPTYLNLAIKKLQEEMGGQETKGKKKMNWAKGTTPKTPVAEPTGKVSIPGLID